MKKTRRTYVYSLSDHFEEYSNNLEGLNKLYDDLIKSEKIQSHIFVCSHQEIMIVILN